MSPSSPPPTPPPPSEPARPWQPELEVDAARAAELIRARFPELDGQPVEPLGEGWDNAAYLVGGTHVFRFPRRALAGRIMLGELAALPLLPDDLPLAVPRLTHRGEPVADYPYTFAGYPLLHGTPACRRSWDDEQRLRLALPLAEFLRRLHDLDADAAREAGVFEDELRRLELPYRRDKVTGLLRRGSDEGWFTNPRSVEFVLEELPTTFEARADTFVHGDLYACHVLVDERGTPTGVIDWGDAHVGDPAGDLGIVEGSLSPEGRRRFFESYGEVAPTTRAIARLKALQHALFLVVYARERGDTAVEAEYRTSLERIAQRD